MTARQNTATGKGQREQAKPRAISPARRIAFKVLMAVEEGGFATEMIRARTARLSHEDASLVYELVLGVLRYRAQLDYLIEYFSGKRIQKLDLEVVNALRLGIYQLRYLAKIPRHAAVNESVELVKRSGVRSAAGFVNAVLRKVDDRPIQWPSREIALSTPEWLLAKWEKQYGWEIAEKIARASLQRPSSYVRVPPGKDPASLFPSIELEPTEVEGCYRVCSGNVSSLRCMDISSQTIVPLLELQPDQWFLDVCAAPGNKTLQALEYGVMAVAVDLHENRLEGLRGVDRCFLVVADAREPLPFRRAFPRILVDVPCSGTGTLARHPEIKWRLKPEDLFQLQQVQLKILENALALLEKGGLLVYSTCSLEQEENEQVIEKCSGRVLKVHRRIPGFDEGDGFFAAVITSE